MPSIPRGRVLGLTSLFVLVVAACANEPQAAYAQTPQPQQPPPPQPPAGEYYAEDGSQAEEVTVGSDGETYQDTDPSALTDFHSTLDSHGAWVDDPTYGQIWVPNNDEVGPDFAPYVSEGSWAYDDDYVWVSNYEWGWVPFHYGRWAWASGRWGWIPGRVYSGAWVSWRVGPEGYGYCGWGPRAPVFGWHGGVAYGLGVELSSRPGPAVFVPREGLFGPRVGARVVVGPRLATVAAETHPFGSGEAGPAGHITQGVMHGPPPASLGIQASAVVHVDPTNPNVARAKAFAHPSSAQAAGAHAPSAHKVRVRRGSGSSTVRAGSERPVERVERGEGERSAPEPRRAPPPQAAPPPPAARGGARGGHGGRR